MNARSRMAAPRPTHLQLVSAEDFGAIAVDTNIYKEYGFRVRAQPLIELPQLKALSIIWLVPEFWELELQRHVLESTEKVNVLRRDLVKVQEWGSPIEIELAGKLAASLTAEPAAAVAQRLLEEHFSAGSALRLATAWASGPSVLSAYFGGRAPFEVSGAKKNEFPDAFALATLESWARKNETKVLVVSRDIGCQNACKASEFLACYSNLPDALAALRKADAGRKTVIEEYERLLAAELSDEASALRRSIDAALEKEVPDLEFDIDFYEQSGQECDHEVTYVRVDRIRPAGSLGRTGPKVRVFAATIGELSFVCEFDVTVDVEARFARVASRGRSSNHIDSAPDQAAEGSLEIEAIITLQPTGALSAQTIPHANVRRIELDVKNVDIDFGAVQAWEPGYEE